MESYTYTKFTKNMDEFEMMKGTFSKAPFAKVVGNDVTMISAGIYESDGETIATIDTEEYGVIAGNSSVVVSSLSRIIDYCNKLETVPKLKLHIVEGISKSEKTFFDIILV